MKFTPRKPRHCRQRQIPTVTNMFQKLQKTMFKEVKYQIKSLSTENINKESERFKRN